LDDWVVGGKQIPRCASLETRGKRDDNRTVASGEWRVVSEEKRDANPEVTEVRTQRAQRTAKRRVEMTEGFIARKA